MIINMATKVVAMCMLGTEERNRMEPKQFYVQFENAKNDEGGLYITANDCAATDTHVTFYGPKNRVIAMYRAKDVVSVIDCAANANFVPVNEE